jgi:hypothetical protein
MLERSSIFGKEIAMEKAAQILSLRGLITFTGIG